MNERKKKRGKRNRCRPRVMKKKHSRDTKKKCKALTSAFMRSRTGIEASGSRDDRGSSSTATALRSDGEGGA